MKKKSAIERFFGWISSCKKVFPGYEVRNIIFESLNVTCYIRLNRVKDRLGIKSSIG